MPGREDSMAHLLMLIFMSALLLSLLPATSAQAFDAKLTPGFYTNSCPPAESIVFAGVQQGQFQDARVPASILRLHFHDCFVNGCDASILLDDTPTFTGEKNAGPNRNSIRGFAIIDQIKFQLELQCPGVVSCADVLAIAARDAVILSGGPSWQMLLGRRDSISASQSAANRLLPTPFDSVPALVSKFGAFGLTAQDMVTLSGAHTIGLAKCSSFNARLFNFTQGQPDTTLDTSFLPLLQQFCSPGPSNLVVLDASTPSGFDNGYYANLQFGRGLLRSDQVLYSTGGFTQRLVDSFANNQDFFFASFAQSMQKLQSLSPLTGNQGEVRSNCRFTNS